MKELNICACFLVISTILPFLHAKCPDKPRGSTRKYNGQCLEFIRQQYYQPDAKQKCEEFNGHLVTVENKEKQSWLENTLTELQWVSEQPVGSAVWLGMVRHRRNDSDQWRWYYDSKKTYISNSKYPSEDELITYSNWDIDEPDKTKNRDCAAFGYATDFKWVGAICDEFPSGFLVVCQYDGPTGFFGNLAVCIPVMLLIIAAIIISILSVYYCNKRSQALRNRLNSNSKMDREAFSDHEQHIKNTDNDINRNNNFSQNGGDNMQQPHYAPVTNFQPNSSSIHNFNIVSDSAYHHDKLHQKDLSLDSALASGASNNRHEYNRSTSAPPPYQEARSRPEASAPSAEENIREVDIDNIKDTEPLRLRPDSTGSNNLSV